MKIDANKLRYDTAFQQGKHDALGGLSSTKPFGDVARAGYSDGYEEGTIEALLSEAHLIFDEYSEE